MFQTSTIATSAGQLLQVISVPAFMVYDGMDQELDAMILLERLKEAKDYSLSNMQHCCKVL
eukprot:12431740-Ditylum_brightwellii.AAC.1